MIPDYLQKELNILFFIIKKDKTSLRDISTSLGISKQTVKSNMVRINQSFDQYLTMKDFITSDNTGTIRVNQQYEKKAVECSYILKLKLLKLVVIFNYAVLLTTRSVMTKQEVLDLLFISESYFTKLTHKLNTFLKPYHIKIIISDNKVFLEGNEVFIRLFSYIFLQDSFQDLEWPFTNISIDEIKSTVPPEGLQNAHQRSNTKERSLYIFYAILYTRINEQNFIKNPDSTELLSFFELIKNNFDVALIFHKNRFGHLSQINKKNEILVFNFLSRIFISDIIPREQKIQLGKTFSIQKHSYCVLSKDIYTRFSTLTSLVLSEEKEYIYIYYLSLIISLYNLIGDAFLSFVDLYIPKLTIYLPKKDNLADAIKEKLAPIINDEHHLEMICNLLHSLLHSEKNPKIYIYLQMTKDFTAIYVIKNRLSSLYNNNNISVTSDYSKADIIVTDTLEKATPNKHVFYLDSTRNMERWTELTTIIQDKFREKINLGEEL
ncbi:M protein trans-acting positive regulator [Listeria grandensis]|uniref:helix-turn-helix domain-containing protein n=1 Tax=Listeria grandensis TaxID=1494963 RepID=UPI0016282799|nr:helix-turn-helix domain-containing protein [Listeria grandensis]MBC1474596.1 M protein trans-acting positive regulator [Listeria grandensis]